METAIQTLNGHLWLNVGRDLYARLTSAYKERELSISLFNIDNFNSYVVVIM